LLIGAESNEASAPITMAAIYDKDRHSRSSSKTDIPDLEKGESRHEKEEEEEDVIADKVRLRETRDVAYQLTSCRSRNRLTTKSARISRSTCQERVRRRINCHQKSTH
jgi:hypothetical protein